MQHLAISHRFFGNLMKIIARNLSRETTEAELTAFFAEFGLVESCTLVMDQDTGKSKGFGFIEMPKHIEAKLAIKRLNAKKIAGSVIRVKLAEDAAKK
jgi:RNA recognition motif-containing protein